jgi:acyl-CoA thioesterase I
MSFALIAVVLAADPVRVACVGDSITWGAGLPERERQCYPAVLGRSLGSGYEVKNYGINGRTVLAAGDMPYTASEEYKAALASGPSVVVIALGTNDTKPHNWKHANDFGDDYGKLAKAFLELPSKPTVYACLPPPAFPGDWGIDDVRIRLGVIPKVKKAAEELKLPVIDLYAEFDRRGNLFPDKVHPNAAGAERIAAAVAKAIKK